MRLLTDWRYLEARVAGGAAFPLARDVRNAAAALRAIGRSGVAKAARCFTVVRE